ncbi:unnamed protein product [Didymodactylos carnosus]|uniref:PiggyBac transposable element-derived protein domain-containing protein n=1 Tax=Didymodactylos carnosus TaxID=1234261 RepID=A0A8S2HR95_9BILA|nr:unnamed protein product [Didymodactylos carnosus]CAF3674471.1 unnamed protein product [Didymodactylos carnosus]
MYLDDFEDTSSEHPSEMDTDGSEDNESESRSDQDDEGDGSGSKSDEDGEDGSGSDENNSEGDEYSEDDSGDDDGDSEDDEGGNEAALQSSLVYNCPWTTDFHPPPARAFHKSRKCVGVSSSSPIQTFRRLFCDQVFNLILEQTNIYERQKYAKARDAKPGIDITRSELEKFIGVNIIMGYCRHPSIDSYWSTDESFRNERISKSMPCKTFKRILGNLHLVDNQHSEKQNEYASNKLYKVSNFLELLKRNFQRHFDPGEKLTIDEMMIKFKGRSSLKQYIKQKPIKRGYKVWIPDTLTGYVYNFDIYSGKSEERRTPLGEHVVGSLTKELSTKFHHVYFDNFFTLPFLVEKLLRDGIYCTGTLRSTRKGIPADIIHKTKMSRGDAKYLSVGSISIVKWMDRKPVLMMSNVTDPGTMTSISRKSKNGKVIQLQCPVMVQDYNFGKVGVDRVDQRIQYYAVDRKSRRNWLRIFFHFLNVALSNAFVLYCRDHPDENMRYLEFVANIAEELIGRNSSVKRKNGRPPHLEEGVPIAVRKVNHKDLR